MMPPKQPKISQKLVLRTAIGLFVLAGLIFGFVWLKGTKGDIGDLGSIDSIGAIAAIEQTADGSQVVYFDGKGDKHAEPDYKPGTTEKDPIWSNDGNRIFFSSDREKQIYQIFRWNAATDAKPENRAPSTLKRFKPQLDPFGGPDDLLFIQQGLGYRLDVKAGKASRIFPPIDQHRAEEQDNNDNAGPGGSGSFDFGLAAEYGLVSAKWVTPTWLVGVRRLEDRESLIAQSTEMQNGMHQPYVVLFTGKHISFDVSTANGLVICAIEGFRFNEGHPVPSQFIKDGKIVPPFRNVMIKGTLDELLQGLEGIKPKQNVLMASNKENEIFGDVALSPNGTEFAVTLATSDPNEPFKPVGLAVFTLDPSKPQTGRIAVGEIFDPCWSPDGQTLAFSMRDGKGNRPIYTIPKAGGTQKLISSSTGIFTSPVFSPQTGAKP